MDTQGREAAREIVASRIDKFLSAAPLAYLYEARGSILEALSGDEAASVTPSSIRFSVASKTATAETITDVDARVLADRQVELIIDQSSLKTLGKKWHREMTCVSLDREKVIALRDLLTASLTEGAR